MCVLECVSVCVFVCECVCVGECVRVARPVGSSSNCFCNYVTIKDSYL